MFGGIPSRKNPPSCHARAYAGTMRMRLLSRRVSPKHFDTRALRISLALRDSPQGFRVRRQNRVPGLRPPAALRPDAVTRHAFESQTHLLQHADAGMVFDRDIGGNPMEAKVAEAKVDQPANHLGAIAATAMAR